MLEILLLILLIANIPDYRIKKLAGLPRTGWRAMELLALKNAWETIHSE